MKPYTDITILLDRSGSMASIKGAMEEGFNAFILEHKKNPSTRVTLVEFDSTSTDTVYENQAVASVPKLNLLARGGTPLIDALATTIDKTGQRLSAMAEKDRPKGVVFVIITDGEENSSQKYTRQDVNDRITKQTNDYKWEFVFMGANQDAIQEARSYGIAMGKAYDFSNTFKGTRSAFTASASNTACYATSTASGMNNAFVPDANLQQRIDMADNDQELLKKAKDLFTPTTTTTVP